MPATVDRVVLAALALAIQLPLWNRWISLLDEGAIAQIADDLNHGLVLYRDTAYLAFPGIFYSNALLYRLVGPSLLAGRAVMVVLFVVMTLLVHALTLRLAGRAGAAAAAIAFVFYRPWAFPHWQMLSYSTPAILLVTAALLVLLGALARPGRRGIVAAGLLFGLGVVFKQDYGGYTVVAAHAALALRALGPRRRPWLGVLSDILALDLGVAAVVLPTLLLLAAAGAFPDFLIQAVVGPLFVHPFWSPGKAAYLSFFGLRPLLAQNPLLHSQQMLAYLPSLLIEMHWREVAAHPLFRDTIVVDTALKVIYLLPYALLVAMGWRTYRRRHLAAAVAWEREMVATLVMGALLLSFNKPRDWVHLMILYYPTFVIGAVLATAVAARGPGWRRAVTAAAVAVLLTFGASAVLLLIRAVRHFDTPLHLARAHLQVRTDEAAVLEELVGHLERETRPGTPVLSLPYWPLVNFLADRPSVSRFRVLVPVEPYADRDEQVIAALRLRPDTVVVYGYSQMPSLPPFAEFAPTLHAYLMDHYRLARSFSAAHGGYIFGLLERTVPAPSPAVDLLARLPEAVVEERAGGTIRRLDGAQRDRVANVVRWTYLAPVLAVRPTVGGTRVVRMDVTVPGRARLLLRAGVNPDEWNRFPPVAVDLSVRVIGPAGTIAERVLHLEPQRVLTDRRWQPLEVDLAGVSGESVTVELGAGTPDLEGDIAGIAGFEAPRIETDLAPATGEGELDRG